MVDCLFCKIRDGQIPAKVVYRDEHCLAFEDIHPQAPTHLLFIPLEHIETINQVTAAQAERMGHLFVAAAKVARERGHAESGYRLVVNCNRDAGQLVFHVHLHMLAGRRMTWPPG
jgi:histidine triad (HIT) family protein